MSAVHPPADPSAHRGRWRAALPAAALLLVILPPGSGSVAARPTAPGLAWPSAPAVAFASAACAAPRPQADEITEDELRAHVETLASEKLAGRGTGQPGLRRAAEYVAARLAEYGLEPAGDETDGTRGFLQRFEVPRGVDGKPAVAWNVLATLPGVVGDPDLSAQTVVVGAHYDHLGATGGAIHFGADDNASGTAGVLALARHLAARARNRRRLVFAFFGAEEVGVLGSRHYVLHPPVPLAATVCMINLDMVGRKFLNSQANRVACVGGETSALLKRVAARALERHEVRPQYVSVQLVNRLWGISSDHYRFYEQRVPVLYFSTSMHPDYHQPTDTPDKIEYRSMTRIVRAAALCALVASELDEAPRWELAE